MIQRYIFDSSAMDIKKLGNSIIIFITKRLIEISGIIITLLGILLFLALISYSPEDPNFIFPENFEIKNYLGFRGSYTSDLFLQSLGLIAFLKLSTLLSVLFFLAIFIKIRFTFMSTVMVVLLVNILIVLF